MGRSRPFLRWLLLLLPRVKARVWLLVNTLPETFKGLRAFSTRTRAPGGCPSDNDRGNGLPGLLRWARTIPHAARLTRHDLLLLGGCLNGDRANEARKVKLWPILEILEVELWPIWHLYGTYERVPAQTSTSLWCVTTLLSGNCFWICLILSSTSENLYSLFKSLICCSITLMFLCEKHWHIESKKTMNTIILIFIELNC